MFVDEKFFVIIDEIELAQEGAVQWLLHGLHEFQIKDNEFESMHNGVGLRTIFAGTDMKITQGNEFEGVNAAEIEGLDPQWHVTASTAQARKSHRIVTLVYPYRRGEEEALQVTAENEITVHLGDKHITISKEEESYYIR